jgi:hypothetical protein
MATKISKADLSALPIPPERVNLRIVNAAIVSDNFATAITTALLIGFHLSNSTNVPATTGQPRPIPTSAGPCPFVLLF